MTKKSGATHVGIFHDIRKTVSTKFKQPCHAEFISASCDRKIPKQLTAAPTHTSSQGSYLACSFCKVRDDNTPCHAELVSASCDRKTLKQADFCTDKVRIARELSRQTQSVVGETSRAWKKSKRVQDDMVV